MPDAWQRSTPFERGTQHGLKDGGLPHKTQIVGMRAVGGAFTVITQEIVTGHVEESGHTFSLQLGAADGTRENGS